LNLTVFIEYRGHYLKLSLVQIRLVKVLLGLWLIRSWLLEFCFDESSEKLVWLLGYFIFNPDPDIIQVAQP